MSRPDVQEGSGRRRAGDGEPQAGRIELIRAEAEVERLVPEWTALTARCTAATPFTDPGWVLVWWRQRQHLGLDWRCLSIRSHDDTLAGVLPLVRYPDGVVRYAGHDLHDTAGALAEPDVLDQVWCAAITRLRESGDCCSLDLPTLAESDAAALRDLAGDHRVYDVDPGARLALPTTFAEYWSTLTNSRRKRMRAERHALERDHGSIVFDMVDQGAELSRATDELWELREDAWQQRGRYPELAGHVRGSALRDLLADLAGTNGSGAGLVAVGRLTVGRRLAGAALLLHARQRVWYAMCAFAPALARYGPGRLLLAECVRAAIDRGLAAVELGRGVEEYKFALGATRYELPNVLVRLGSSAEWSDS